MLLEGPSPHRQGHDGDLPGRQPPDAVGRLDEFERNWGDRYPSLALSWRANWGGLIRMFGFFPEVRRLLYTTNSFESLP